MFEAVRGFCGFIRYMARAVTGKPVFVPGVSQPVPAPPPSGARYYPGQYDLIQECDQCCQAKFGQTTDNRGQRYVFCQLCGQRLFTL